MANFVYGKAKQAILNGNVNFSSDNFKLLFVDTSVYTVNQNSDEFVSNISNSAIKARSANLSSVTNTLGTVDADNVLLQDYSGASFQAIVMYQVGTSDSNSRLISYIDTSDGLPFNGTNSLIPVTIVWSDLSTKILSL